MKNLGKIAYSTNNIYIQSNIMKCAWPNAASFNIGRFY
jgi:hypothetical protein